MKRILIITFITTGVILASSFTKPGHPSSNTEKVDFMITNNTNTEFKYCVNGGHNTISSGVSRSFSYSPGQEINLIDGSSCGKPWLEVTSDMNGKKYKLTELLNNKSADQL
jgi:hypothetical protein